MFDRLIEIISQRTNISESEIALIKSAFEAVHFPKNEILETAGNVPQYLYFINSGFLRLFYLDQKGDEVTTHINCPPGFFSSYNSFANQIPSEENVESITDCSLLRISKENLDALVNGSPAMSEFRISVFQESLQFNEARAKDLATLNARERYLKLAENQKEILQHVPVQIIASYLGMKPESLSRIRRKLIP